MILEHRGIILGNPINFSFLGVVGCDDTEVSVNLCIVPDVRKLLIATAPHAQDPGNQIDWSHGRV
jgi:hypothetical protein